jgi:predicted RNA methylase
LKLKVIKKRQIILFNQKESEFFFVEAKKPSVNIKTDPASAFQLKRYGWNANLAISILSSFEYLSVYDCSFKPKESETSTRTRIKIIHYKNYIKEFDYIWNNFSKDSVESGSLNKFIKRSSKTKGSTSVDDDFLESLSAWRIRLAKDIHENNSIDEYQLNIVVQQLIDRIIFLRIAEDRDVEDYRRLMLATQTNAYENIQKIFVYADKKYNSGLFAKNSLMDSVKLSDSAITKLIKNLYYPDSPYEFSYIPIEILGKAYEQFLGKEIKLTSGNNIKIKDKPSVKKSKGVYYTPKYIVDYIISETLEKICDAKSPEEISEIKIVDPSCGSGSFLIGVYEYLLKWHKDYFATKSSSKKKLNEIITPEGELTTSFKGKILLNNIYGVDIDSNAVEVTKLSLLLKCLEGETRETLQSQFQALQERLLPTLDDNIKCGNALIDYDIFSLFPDIDEDIKIKRKINSFNWRNSFKKIFQNGGFDLVIGNPPYGAELNKTESNYLKDKFDCGSTDTAALFMNNATNITKKGGYNSFIIPKSFTYASNWEKTRNNLIGDLNILSDCSKVWPKVKYEMAIYVLKKGSNSDCYESFVRSDFEMIRVNNFKKEITNKFGFIVNGVSQDELDLGLKLINENLNLSEYIVNVRGGMFQKHVKNSESYDEKNEYRVLGGKQVQPFFVAQDLYGVVSKSKIEDDGSFIKPNSVLFQNIVAHIQNPKPHVKIIGAIVPDSIKHQYAILDTINQVVFKNDIKNSFVLGLLTSNLISWYVYKFIFANAIRTMHFDSTATDRIPIPPIEKIKADFSYQKICDHVEQIIQLNQTDKTKQLGNETVERIRFHQDNINQLVYGLYNVDQVMINVVEQGLYV